MPPLCTVGFGVGSGLSWPIITGAGLLFLTNLAAIMASAFVAFFAVRMDAPELRTKIDCSILEHASSDRLYRLLMKTRLARTFGDIGKLRWRILVATLGVFRFIPLRQSLYQLREETIARTAANEAVRLLTSPGMIFTEQLDVTPERLILRMIVTETVPADRIQEAEKLLLRRTGKEVTVSVRKVASEEELALLRERFRTPPAPPPPQDLGKIREDLIRRVEKPLREVWPAESAPLISSYEVGFTPEEILVRVRYQSKNSLVATAEAMLTKVLQTRLNKSKLKLILERETPPRTASRKSR